MAWPEAAAIVKHRSDTRKSRRNAARRRRAGASFHSGDFEGLDSIGSDTLNAREKNLAALYFLSEGVGSDSLGRKAKKRLEKHGIDVSKLDRSTFAEGTEEDAIRRLAESGAIGGKKAALFQTELTRNRALDRLDTERGYAESEARSDIARSSTNLGERLSAMVPAEADLSSGAGLAVRSEFQRAREEGLAGALREIDRKHNAGKTAIESAALKDIGPLLENIGLTVDALDRLKEEESRMAGVERATIYGGALFNPVRGLGSLVGQAAGGRSGAVAGGEAAFGGITDTLALLQALGGMPAGGGRAGQKSTSANPASVPGYGNLEDIFPGVEQRSNYLDMGNA